MNTQHYPQNIVKKNIFNLNLNILVQFSTCIKRGIQIKLNITRKIWADKSKMWVILQDSYSQTLQTRTFNKLLSWNRGSWRESSQIKSLQPNAVCETCLSSYTSIFSRYYIYFQYVLKSKYPSTPNQDKEEYF